ncbi:MAG: signal peptidase II [Endomicrobia bacterium]|nr:signal peptidase II [Endomicrobiia bacterium]
MTRFNLLYILCCVFLIFLDQITKFIVRTNFHLYQSKQILPFLAITYTTNTGIVFGWFQGANLIFTVIIVFILATFLFTSKSIILEFGTTGKIVIGLIICGGVGNLIDRIFFGKVTDFIDLQWNYKNIWPIFNLADSYIFVGVWVLVIKYLVLTLKRKKIYN